MNKLLLSIILLIASRNLMAEHPNEIPIYIEWSFEIQASPNREAFYKQVKEYHKEISSQIPWYSPLKIYHFLVNSNLDKSINYKKINLIYEYAEETTNGDWIDHEKELLVENQEGITLGEILYVLHHETGSNLHNQDIMAIEGMELKEGSENAKVPTYYVFFGS